MKKVKLEFEVPDDVYQELTKLNKHFKDKMIEDIVRSFYSVMIGETRGYFFTEEAAHGVAILNKEWVDEILKREYRIDENAVKERNALQKKIDAINAILKS